MTRYGPPFTVLVHSNPKEAGEPNDVFYATLSRRQLEEIERARDGGDVSFDMELWGQRVSKEGPD